MRRYITTVVSIVAAFASGACEDGPSQTFTAAPTGAANVWNGTPASGGFNPGGTFVSPATQTYDAGVAGGGQNANDLCTAAQEKAIWTDNFRMPIIPNPGLGAGLDLAGGPNGGGIADYDPGCISYNKCNPSVATPNYTYPATAIEPWTGVTLDQAQALLCQALQPASPFGPSSAQGWAGWGESDEVNVFYNINNRQLTDIFFFPGYVGNVVGVCEPGAKGVPANALGACTTETTYTISMYNNVFMTEQVKGSQPTNIILSWNSNPNTNKYANLIYESLRQTYLPNFPADVDCVAAGHCIIDNNLTSDGILFFTPFNFAIFVANTVATSSAGTSIPLFLDVGVTKILPFGPAEVTMKLDPQGIGPIAYASPTALGNGTTKSCTYQLGMTYADFEADCVQPYTGTPNGALLNQVAQAKLLGALAHSDENYEFDIQGVDPQFTATIGATQVIADGQTPSGADIAYQLNIDQFVLGPIANDFTDNDATKAKDWHGIGILTFQWAYQIQQYMAANYGVNTDLGDPYCIANFFGGEPLRPGSLGGSTGGDAGTADSGGTTTDGAAEGGDAGKPTGPVACSPSKACSSAAESCAAKTGGICGTGSTGCTCQPKVCSGLEGIVTTAPPTLVDTANHPTWANNMLGASGTTVNTVDPLTGEGGKTCTLAQMAAQTQGCATNGITVGMKPGTWYSLFCADAGGFNKGGFPNGYNHCIGGVIDGNNPYTGYYFDTILTAVSYSYGHIPGATGGLPVPEELASRRFYFQEWMLALVKYLRTAGDPTTPIATINNNPADPNEFYFDPINGSFESANYIVRDTVNSGHQAPTQLNIATNLQTSVVNNFAFSRHNFRGETALYTALKTTASDQPGAEPLFIQNVVGSSALQAVYGAYPCAVNPTSMGCGGNPAPIDPVTGASIFVPYEDSFGTSSFTIPAIGGASNNSGLTVDSTTYELIQSANVTVPIYQQPFSVTPTSKPSGSITELLPYLNGAGVGFPITIDGSRDKFYNTQNIDFSGATVSASVDFEYVYSKNPDGTVAQQTAIRAVETSAYLGLVFPCVEFNAAGSIDVLAVRMYDNADTILNWIAAHQAMGHDPVPDCGIQIKQSIYGNYADYITFGVNPAFPLSGSRFGLNAGYGGSVISDVTIFDPNIVSALGQ